jgi:hypothetical protein
MAGVNYFDSNRTNTVILKLEAVKVMSWSFDMNLLQYANISGGTSTFNIVIQE